jgi:hypothetical protein
MFYSLMQESILYVETQMAPHLKAISIFVLIFGIYSSFLKKIGNGGTDA